MLVYTLLKRIGEKQLQFEPATEQRMRASFTFDIKRQTEYRGSSSSSRCAT